MLLPHAMITPQLVPSVLFIWEAQEEVQYVVSWQMQVKLEESQVCSLFPLRPGLTQKKYQCQRFVGRWIINVGEDRWGVHGKTFWNLITISLQSHYSQQMSTLLTVHRPCLPAGSPIYLPHPGPHFLHPSLDLAIWPTPSYHPGLCYPYSHLQQKLKMTSLIFKVSSSSLKGGGGWVEKDDKCSLSLLSCEE